MYVEPKFSTFKEELLNYPDLNPTHYNTIILPKITEYNETQTVQQTRPYVSHYDGTVQLYYDIDDDQPLHIDHLLAVTLYCDYTSLCTTFSSTFRPLNPFEPLFSIVARNRNYYWMSRRLREAVQLYGNGYYGDMEDVPYSLYTGLSFEGILPAFEIRFRGPTSTSSHIEVAMKFAGDDGIMIVIANNIPYHRPCLRAFSCSWIQLS